MPEEVRSTAIARRAAKLALALGLAATLAAGPQPGRAEDAIPTAAAGPASAQMEADCYDQLIAGTAPEIACAFPALMTPDDRNAIRKVTRQIFKDAHCMIQVKIARQLIDEALSDPEARFEAPPQTVSCVVETSKGNLPIEFTFAPKVEFKGGVAVTATPGMDNVKGVNSWLAWPVVKYVNASGSISDIMLRVVNAYVKRYGPSAEAQQ